MVLEDSNEQEYTLEPTGASVAGNTQHSLTHSRTKDDRFRPVKVVY